MVVWGFVVGVLLGCCGRGFQWAGFRGCGVEPSGFCLGWGSLYKHKIITLGKSGAVKMMSEQNCNKG